MNYRRRKPMPYIISVIAILLAALIFFWQYDRKLNDTFSQIDGQNLEAYTQSLSKDVTGRIKDVESSVKSIAKAISPKMEYYTRSELNELLTEISTDIKSFNLSYTSFDELGGANFSKDQTRVFTLLKENESVVSDALYRPDYRENQPFFGVYAPVVHKGEVIGFVRALLKIDVLNSSNQEGFLRDSVITKVVYSNGDFLSNLKTGKDINLFTVMDEVSDDEKNLKLLKDAFSGDKATVVKVNVTEGDAYIACSPLPYNDWHIFSTCTVSSLAGYKEDVSSLTFLTLFAVCAVAIIIGILVFLFVRKQNQKIYAELDRFALLINFSDTLLCEYTYADDLLSLTPNAIGLLDMPDTQIPHFSQAMVAGSLVHKDDLAILVEFLNNPPPTDKFQEFELRIKAPAGDYLWMMIEAGVIFDRNGNPVKIIAKLTDNSRARHQIENLKEKAENDTLTGMLRHYKFKEMVVNLLESPDNSEWTKALCMIDGDKFKTINDQYGHSVGDLCLIQVSETLRHVTSDYALISRYGGDEFLLFIHSCDSLEKAVEDVLNAISSISVPGHPDIHLSASLGGVVYDGRMSYDQMFIAADHNLYTSKGKDPGSYTLT